MNLLQNFRKHFFCSALIAVLTFVLAVDLPSTYGQGRFDTMATRGDAVPGANGTFSSFSDPVLNSSGQTAFSANLKGTSGGLADGLGIFRASAGVITQIAREGQAAPDANGTFSTFPFISPVFNDSGQAAFSAHLTGTSGGFADDFGIFRASAGAITQIVRESQVAPDANGTFSQFSAPVLNDSGQTAFSAHLTGTSGGSADNRGIFRARGGAIIQIARVGQATPDANGTFLFFSNPVLNDSGQIAFEAGLTGTSSGITDNSGIFRSNGGAITQIVREGQAAPDANGMFSSFFSSPVLNDSGQTAFLAVLTGTSGVGPDNIGIFRGSGGAITQIARVGQAAPDANGTFSKFSSRPVINDSGQTAFRARLRLTSGGSADDRGIYIADGTDLIQVAREGDALLGSTITAVRDLTKDGLNRHGQIAYLATLLNGNQTIQRWTPDLHWRSSVTNSWDASGQWTLGLNPDSVHDVFIDPSANLTVTGSASDRTVRSLQIGGGSGVVTLDLTNGTVLTATNGTTITSTGKLTGDGTLGGNINNDGGIIQISGDSHVTFSDNVVQNGTMQVDSDGSSTSP